MSESPESPPKGWQQSLAEFVSARLDLIRLEARQAGRETGFRVVLVAVAALAAVGTWALAVAGLIGWLTALVPDWRWFHFTLLAAALHLMVGVVAVMALRRRASTPPFPLTRQEIAKDREWLETLKQTKSSD